MDVKVDRAIARHTRAGELVGWGEPLIGHVERSRRANLTKTA